MLRVFAWGISDKELLEVKNFLLQLFADRLTDEVEAVLTTKGISVKESDAWAYEYNSRNAGINY